MRSFKSFLFICISFLVISSCDAQKPQGSNKYDTYLNKLFQEGNFNGNVLVFKDGKIAHQGAYGIKRFDPIDSLQLGDAFRLASVSKQFTAMAIMMLKEQGKLNYDQNIRDIIPELPYEGITIRHLLTHQSGLPDYVTLLNKNWKSNIRQDDPARFISGNDDIINLLAEKKPPILFQPGEKFEYSNTGYVLLASIVIKASGLPFETFLKNHIFDPLGMKNTSVYSYVPGYDENMPNRVFGFRKSQDGNKFIPNDCNYLNMAQGDGGIFSTVGDLLKWDRTLNENKLVSEGTLAEAFTPGVLNGGRNTSYGFGWFIGNSSTGKKVVSHSGGWVGFMTHIEREIEENNCIIVLTNNTAGRNFGRVMDKLRELLHED